jgi:hypothetical protein
MPLDYSALLYDPVYAALGVPATLTHQVGTSVFQQNIFQANLFQSNLVATDITVYDDTREKTNTSGALDVRSVGPGAFARIPELTANGIDRSHYDGSSLEFNGHAWIIRSHQTRGSPNGEDLGEVRFNLRSAE